MMKSINGFVTIKFYRLLQQFYARCGMPKYRHVHVKIIFHTLSNDVMNKQNPNNLLRLNLLATHALDIIT